jgi:hypothetical protein
MVHLARVLGLAIVILLVSGSALGSPPSCEDVINEMSPCLRYLMQREFQPSDTCCNGLKYIIGYFDQKEDRQAICECLKPAASMVGTVDYSIIAALPMYCGISRRLTLPPISMDIDCSR